MEFTEFIHFNLPFIYIFSFLGLEFMLTSQRKLSSSPDKKKKKKSKISIFKNFSSYFFVLHSPRSVNYQKTVLFCKRVSFHGMQPKAVIRSQICCTISTNPLHQLNSFSVF